MLKNLDHKKKNILLIAAMLIFLYIAYVFSFKKAIQAMQLYSQLTREQNIDLTANSAFPQISRKNGFYKDILKSYQVKADDRENRLWQNLSGIAIDKNVKISFNPVNTVETDTVKITKGVVDQQFIFKGSYFRLVSLLDSISKSNGIGKISAFKLTTKENDFSKSNTNELMLNVGLTATTNAQPN